eukprot:1713_1
MMKKNLVPDSECQWQMMMLIVLFHFVNLVLGIDTQAWSVNISQDSTMEFNNIFWRNCIGSGHAVLSLRSDWRYQIQSTHNLLKFQSVRFHGILDDVVGAVNHVHDYSFININKIYKHLVNDIGIKPYVEISHVPYLFTPNDCQNHTGNNHYHPCYAIPYDYNIWYDFIQQWIQNLVDTFGINEVSKWPFEVWNEPNNIDWSFHDYLVFYNHTATAIKSISNRLMVGGPSTGAEAWIDDFCNATQVLNIPVDFISTHAYPNHVTNGIKPNYIDSYYDALNKLLQQVKPYDLPIYISEWNSACCANEQGSFYNNDNYYAAAFLVFMVNHLQPLFVGDSLLKWMSYWAVSDIFEEKGFISNEFCDYYGLTTTRGIRKPIFRAFELLQKYAKNAVFKYVAVNMDGTLVADNTVEMFVLKGSVEGQFTVFISNWNLLNLNITQKELNVYVHNYVDEKQISAIVMYRIDDKHTNPLQTWRDMASPEYPTTEQLNKLNESSQLVPMYDVHYTQMNDTTVLLSIEMPIYGVAVLDLKY